MLSLPQNRKSIFMPTLALGDENAVGKADEVSPLVGPTLDQCWSEEKGSQALKLEEELRMKKCCKDGAMRVECLGWPFQIWWSGQAI